MKIRRFEKQRQEKRKQMENLKKISRSCLVNAGTRQFALSKTTSLEQKFGEEIVGLVTKAEFVEKRRTLEERMQVEEYVRRNQEEERHRQFRLQQREQEKKIAKTKLSFLWDEDNEERVPFPITLSSSQLDFSRLRTYPATVDVTSKIVKMRKNPYVDTSFLPDQKREEKIERERKRQDAIKSESLDIVYSYWDGSGHRRKITVRKGDSIGQFLTAVQKQLSIDFREVRSTSANSLMFVKEDMILPHHHTFYELIINEVKGKSGPLFDFGIKKNIRLQREVQRDQDESHAGKVVERHWYDQNKHIFPASRWEVYLSESTSRDYTGYGPNDRS